nr:conjugal transfer protein TraD [uncultured Flavobacterium sp.]
METVIVICLLIIIALLVQDKIIIKKRTEQKPTQQKTNPNLPDIMGQPKPMRSLSVPKRAIENQIKEQEQKTDNFDIEIGEEDVDMQIPQEELDEVFENIPDFEEEEEEEEWNRYGISGGNVGFAQGVTFEELSSVGMLLQKDKLEPSQKETVVAIVQKIQGTELFSLLENSIESASRKIAELLDGSLSSETDAGSSTLRKNDLSDFDIGEFV